MSGGTPLAAAWARVRNTVASTAATYRDEGHTVVEAPADHATALRSDDGSMTLSFTVPDDRAEELAAAVDEGGEYRTEVQYVDVARTRLFVLTVRGATDPVMLLAGGIAHDVLGPHAEDPGAPARTVVRHADGRNAAQFSHERAEPFVAALDGEN